MLEPDPLRRIYRADGRGLAPPGRGTRSLAALLAILVQLAFLLLWVSQYRVTPHRGGGARSHAPLILWSLGRAPGTIHPKAQRRPDQPVPKPAVPAPKVEAVQERPWTPAPPVLPPEEPKQPEAEEAPPMTEREAEEFRRQWAQLQGEVTRKTIEESGHDGLRRDLSETNRPFNRFGPADPDRKPDTSRRAAEEPNSMFAGELCVTHAGRDGELTLALPCIGDGYRTDYGWQARVHAPDRGEPLPGAVDPNGRVLVRNHAFSPEVLAAFEEAQRQLRRIQVTMRLVYLPDLRQSIQLLSRDDRVGAISVEAFVDERELAVYLREWSENVRRWTDREGIGLGAGAGRPAGPGEAVAR
jgi:hypothetical protein